MATKMAILQQVDKCMRCNGCVVACKREWGLATDSIGVMKVGVDQRLAIKSQKRVDMGPYVRFSCWHCDDPPCARACPFGAMAKQENGAVAIDYDLCQPDACSAAAGRTDGRIPCQVSCQRGGYPKVGAPFKGSDVVKVNKCTLCWGRAGSNDQVGTNALPTRAVDNRSKLFPDRIVPELAHEPACVSSCPAKAMIWDTQDNILEHLRNDPGYTVNGSRNWFGGESMFWASKKVLIAPPKADPLVEDHLAPLAGDVMSSSLKVALPTLVVGGLMALSARRSRIEEETVLNGGEV